MLSPCSSCIFFVSVVIKFGQKKFLEHLKSPVECWKKYIFFYIVGFLKSSLIWDFWKNAKIHWWITNKLHYIFLFIKIEGIFWFYNNFIEL